MSYERTVFASGDVIDEAAVLNKFDEALYQVLNNGFITVTSCTVDNVTVNANANSRSQASLVHPAGSGFIPVGVVQVIPNAASNPSGSINGCALQRFEVDAANDSVFCYWRNTTSAAFKIKTTFVVLWIRTGSETPAAMSLTLDE